MRVLKAMALAAIIASCAPLNAGPRLAAYHLLVPGQSTAQDATALLGRPMSSTVIGNTAMLAWMELRDGRMFHVAILFDATGRMIRVQQVTAL